MVRNGSVRDPIFDPKIPRKKSCSGSNMGRFGCGAKGLMLKKFMCLFCLFMGKLENAVLFVGSFWGFSKSRKIPGQVCFLNVEVLQIPRFRALGKANLPRTLGRQCPAPCPHLLHGVFFSQCALTAFSSFSDRRTHQSTATKTVSRGARISCQAARRLTIRVCDPCQRV